MSVEIGGSIQFQAQGAPGPWRGFGGTHATLDSVEFDRQLDRLSLWLETWNHEQRCQILEKLLSVSRHKQVELVWTVIQPAMHRDFMYTAQKTFPTRDFVPISTYTSRDLKDKLLKRQTKAKQTPVHRIRSAHLQHYEQVKDLNQERGLTAQTTTSASAASRSSLSFSLPSRSEPRHEDLLEQTDYSSSKALSQSMTFSPARSTHSCHDNKHSSQSHGSTGRHSNSSRVIKFRLPQVAMQRSVTSLSSADRICHVRPASINSPADTLRLLHSSPACIRFLEMPVRRHIQEEKSPRFHEHSTLSSLSTHKSLDSELSLRERKKRIVRQAKWKKSQLQLPADIHRMISKEGWLLLGWYSDAWNDLQRNEFLHKFLLKLDPRQHYFISSLLAVKQYRDFISLLPEKLALHILSFLPAHDIVNASRVSKLWYERCNTNSLWEMKCREAYTDIPVTGKGPIWKKIFRENIYVKLNWSQGRCKIIDIKGHTDRVLSVTFNRKMLATGSVDKTICIWRLHGGRCLQTLRGHTRGVWCLRFFTKDLLLSGSYDCSIRVWNLREGVCMRTLLSHEGPVWSMVRRNSLMVSASQDRTAKVWDISRCALKHTLRGHNAAVFAVDMDESGTLVLTGSADRTVRLWDAQTAKQLKVVYASQTTSIMSVSYSKGFFACCYGEVILLYQWNGTTAKLLRTYEEHRKRIETIELKITNAAKVEGTMVSAGKDAELKYWNIAKEKSQHTFKGHNQPINCVHCDEMRIGTASYDNKVKIWDFSIL